MGILIAAPFIYIVMSRWLGSFADRVDIGPGLFLLVAMIALVIAFLTVSYQAYRATGADAVRALRTE
jgi:putative ABC transport system permease protein